MVDTRIMCATIPRPSARRVQEACNSTRRKPSSERIRPPLFRPRGPLVRVRGFLLAAVPVELVPAWSLKTQQRETSRLLGGVSLRGEMNPSSFSFGRRNRTHYDSIAGVRGSDLPQPSGRGDKSLHGEFDPGSGRTLAARLTHASRARTRASALGTAANG